MKISKVVNALELFAPLPLQESFDNAGLQVGLTETQEVSGVLLCLDVTEKIVDEAIKEGCNLIVSHHPLIFHKLSHISDEDFVQRIVVRAITNNIVIVSMHTNMDNAIGGVNYKIAEKIGIDKIELLGERKIIGDTEGASGVIGSLSKPMCASDFITHIKQVFKVECVQANELLRRDICRVAVCGGAGSFMLDDAIKAGADAFITGEMHYHDFFDHEQQIQIAVIGHYQSEQYTNEIFKSIIEDACPGVRCCLAHTNTNPIIYL